MENALIRKAWKWRKAISKLGNWKKNTKTKEHAKKERPGEKKNNKCELEK